MSDLGDGHRARALPATSTAGSGALLPPIELHVGMELLRHEPQTLRCYEHHTDLWVACIRPGDRFTTRPCMAEAAGVRHVHSRESPENGGPIRSARSATPRGEGGRSRDQTELPKDMTTAGACRFGSRSVTSPNPRARTPTPSPDHTRPHTTPAQLRAGTDMLARASHLTRRSAASTSASALRRTRAFATSSPARKSTPSDKICVVPFAQRWEDAKDRLHIHGLLASGE